MDKPNRPVRNRRHSRKSWLPGEIHHRQVKRLFTPEIKRMLKDWLVRRRENPYPSRDEKKTLAIDTGLTYTQICNWFANWRRKLKNSGREPQKKTWGHLIKNYNTNAKGNVEQFSICSEDSIWGDDEKLMHFSGSPDSDDYSESSHHHRSSLSTHRSYPQYALKSNQNKMNNNNNEHFSRQYYDFVQRNANETGFTESFKNHDLINNQDLQKYFLKNATGAIIDHCYTPKQPPSPNSNGMVQAQCFQISSTTDDIIRTDCSGGVNGNVSCGGQPTNSDMRSSPAFSNTKYKNHIMEKYLRGLDESSSNEMIINGQKPQLSKWLESAANFTPNKNNYIDWTITKNKAEKKKQKYNYEHVNIIDTSLHQKEELDAAEALTKLAGNFRNRLLNMTSS